jgi:hypothetical protein
MDVDSIVGIFVFLVFVTWGFSYYFMLFEESENIFGVVAGIERDKIIEYMSSDVFEIPVMYNSPDDVNNGVLKAKSIWYHGERNATNVFSGGQSLPCRVSGDDLYWESDLTTGPNYFKIQIADLEKPMNCSGTFSISSFNLTEPWVFENKKMISLTKINDMMNMSYDDFKEAISVNEDFKIKIERAGGDIEYGKSIPEGPANVVSKQMERKIFETSEIVNITVAVW